MRNVNVVLYPSIDDAMIEELLNSAVSPKKQASLNWFWLIQEVKTVWLTTKIASPFRKHGKSNSQSAKNMLRRESNFQQKWLYPVGCGD